MSNFVLEIMRILAWPLALLAIAFIFRNELRKLVLYNALPKERKLNVRLAESLDEARMIADSILEESGIVYSEEESAKSSIFVARNDLIKRLTQSSPRAAIIETWVEIEAVIIEVAYQAEIFSRGPMASRRVLDRLIEKGEINKRILSFYKWMRDIRNKATHLPDGAIDRSDAERYCELSNIMIEILNQKTSPKKSVDTISQTFSD
jgi:hypothetical protein